MFGFFFFRKMVEEKLLRIFFYINKKDFTRRPLRFEQQFIWTIDFNNKNNDYLWTKNILDNKVKRTLIELKKNFKFELIIKKSIIMPI